MQEKINAYIAFCEEHQYNQVYSTEEEKDTYHCWSVKETIRELKDRGDETNWYIDDNKNIVFYYSENHVKIPYEKISDAIYPEYLDALNE